MRVLATGERSRGLAVVSEKVGSASQSISEEREAPKAAPAPAPPAGQRTFNKILKPQITPMDVVGIAREAAAAGMLLLTLFDAVFS